MFGPPDGQLVGGVVMDDLRDGVERGAVLAQDVLSFPGHCELHVHEAMATPAEIRIKHQVLEF